MSKSIYLLIFILFFSTNFIYATKIVHLTNDNFVALRGPVSSTSIAELISNLLDKHDDVRYIYLNTNGGSVMAGMKLINVINDLENDGVEVNCIADTAISMGFVIFQACTRRYVLSYSTLMQHQMSLSGVRGKILEINSYMTHINTIENDLNMMQALRINMTQSEFEYKINNDWWLTSREALELNVADEIIMIKCIFPKEKEVVEVNTIFGDVVITYMKCPQVSSPIKVELKANDNSTPNFNDIKNIKDIIDNNFNKITPRYFDKFIDIIGFNAI
jgi:ATP-dependent Clp endopeptidase proteolytic subunit ClpP